MQQFVLDGCVVVPGNTWKKLNLFAIIVINILNNIIHCAVRTITIQLILV